IAVKSAASTRAADKTIAERTLDSNQSWFRISLNQERFVGPREQRKQTRSGGTRKNEPDQERSTHLYARGAYQDSQRAARGQLRSDASGEASALERQRRELHSAAQAFR